MKNLLATLYFPSTCAWLGVGNGENVSGCEGWGGVRENITVGAFYARIHRMRIYFVHTFDIRQYLPYEKAFLSGIPGPQSTRFDVIALLLAFCWHTQQNQFTWYVRVSITPFVKHNNIKCYPFWMFLPASLALPLHQTFHISVFFSICLPLPFPFDAVDVRWETSYHFHFTHNKPTM